MFAPTLFALVVFVAAALAEIAGCFSFWMVLRLHRSAWWLGPGLVALVLFAALLTRIDAAEAGRAYATYGGVYVCTSLAWLWAVEGTRPDRWDVLGAATCLLGAGIILFGPRPS